MGQSKKIVIANWKMKLGVPQSVDLAKGLKNISANNVEVAVCPSFVSLTEVAKVLSGSVVKLGAQDCFWEASGAYTGEVSANYLREAGCEFVIIGHSERRQYLAETNEMVHKKIKMALAANLIPVLCVGETFEQRQNGAKDYVIIEQTTKALEGLEVGPDQRVIIAYEPVWVIGSGQAIDPQEAAASHQVIRQSLFDIFPAPSINNNFSVIYGGSVDGENISYFTELENIDGVLVGGASLQVEAFKSIIKNV
ncbi:MAG: triose-phosphate isomerase [Candidatus Buchananbacteria bacterium]|nr:triose-phosphate isomerase [Candidatus Buchananbacteria bacterium]